MSSPVKFEWLVNTNKGSLGCFINLEAMNKIEEEEDFGWYIKQKSLYKFHF